MQVISAGDGYVCLSLSYLDCAVFDGAIFKRIFDRGLQRVHDGGGQHLLSVCARSNLAKSRAYLGSSISTKLFSVGTTNARHRSV